MRGIPTGAAVLLAAGAIAAAGWFLLGGGGGAAGPASTAPPAAPPPDRGPATAPPGPPPAPAPPAPADGPLLPAPDAYPWEVPAWWVENDRRFRERELHLPMETHPIAEFLRRIGEAAGLPVRVGPELEAWAAEKSHTLAANGPARALVEELASRNNLELVLREDALVLHQRGRVPDTKEVQAGRVRWSILEAAERRDGKRPPHPEAGTFRAVGIDLALDRVPLREALRRLGEASEIPAYCDEALWRENPPLSAPGGRRTLGEWLDAALAPLPAASDVTPRRIVVFR